MLGDLISKWRIHMGRKDLESAWKQLMKSNMELTMWVGNSEGMVVFSNEPDVIAAVQQAQEGGHDS